MNKIRLALFTAACALTTIGITLSAQQAKPRPRTAAAAPKTPPHEARLNEVEKFWTAGDLTSAAAALSKILEDFPTLLSVHEKAYELYRTWQRPDDAQRTLAIMLERFPVEPSVFIRSADAAAERKDLIATESALRKAIELTLDETAKALIAARLDIIVASRAEAARLQAEADEKQAALSIIERRITDSKMAEAARDLDALLSTYGDDDELRFKASDLLARMGRFDDAEKRLAESIERAKDPDVARVRRLAVKELAYRREVALEAARRQAITVRLKKMSLLVEDGNSKQALADVDALLKEHPRDGFVHAGVHAVYAQAGDFVAAEFHLKTALGMATDQATRNSAELSLVELNHRREKKAADVTLTAQQHIQNGKYAEAVSALANLDKITVYHRAAYMARAGLLGVYRKYEEAVKVYNRLLQDRGLDAGRKEVEALRDYCIRQVTARMAAPKDAHYCPFCGARQIKGAAYCHVCLMFQQPVAEIKAKKERTVYRYVDGRLDGVQYRWEDGHGASNAFAGILGGVTAAAAKTAVDVKFKNSDLVFRDFSFTYEGDTPESVSFRSSATGGEVETFRTDGASGLSYKTGVEGGRDEAASLKDVFVYPTHRIIDPVFAARAFSQNIHRGFAPNVAFNPFRWLQPSLFAMIYDEQGRVTRAVDVYEYGAQTSAGHREVTGRKNFTGEGGRDPLQEPNYIEIAYNPQGLVAMLRRLSGGKELWRRDLGYGPNGLTSERVTAGGKVTERTSYKWSGTTLQSAELKMANYEADVQFRPHLPTQFNLTVDDATAASASDYLVVADRLFALNRREGGMNHLNRAIERFPSDPQPYFARAYAYLQAKATDRAKNDFIKFLALAPNAPQAKAVKQQLKSIDPKGKY